MPVHAVMKDSSTTTKLRAVFDGSARTSSGHSFNDCLLPGTNLYPALLDVLIRFRFHQITLSADISKMFREILLNPGERDGHRFLVRTSDNAIKDARMVHLTFGIKSSPFAATQVLRLQADSHQTSHPSASAVVLRDFYVDDVLTRAPNINIALDLFTVLRDLLNDAGMSLQKWCTSDPELCRRIPTELLETELCCITPSSPLGVHWDTASDTLHVAVPTSPTYHADVTKLMAGVFDVLGLFAPFVVATCIMFQDTWRLGLS